MLSFQRITKLTFQALEAVAAGPSPVTVHRRLSALFELSCACLLILSLSFAVQGYFATSLALAVAGAFALLALGSFQSSEGTAGVIGLALLGAGLSLSLYPQVSGLAFACSTILAAAGAAMFVVGRLRALEVASEVCRHAAMLLHEGQIGCSEYHDQRLSFCRSLTSMSIRADRPLSVIALQRSRSDHDDDEKWLNCRMDYYMHRLLLADLVEAVKDEADILLIDRDRDLFLITCPDVSRDGATKLAEQIRSRASAALGIDVSFGIAERPEFGASFDDLAMQAARALNAPAKGGSTRSEPSAVGDSPSIAA